MTKVNPILVQTHFRGRRDGMSANSTSFTYGLDTNWTQDTGESFRIRFEIEETAGGTANGPGSTIEYSKNGGAWNQVPQNSNGDGIEVGYIASDQTLEDVNVSLGYRIQEATTNIISGSSRAFVAGGACDHTVANAPDLNNQHTEHEFILRFRDDEVAPGDTFQIRIEGLNTYTNTPTITIAEPSFRIRRAGVASSSTSADIIPNLPSGTEENDVLICQICYATAAGSTTMSAGWTQFARSAANGTSLELWWKRAGASETEPTITNTQASPIWAAITGYRGALESGTPVDIPGSGFPVSQGSGQTVTSNNFTPSVSGEIIILTTAAFPGGVGQFVIDDITDPSGWTTILHGSNSTGYNSTHLLSSGKTASTSALGTKSVIADEPPTFTSSHIGLFGIKPQPQFQEKTLTNAAETDQAQTLNKVHIRTITAGIESNTPQALSFTKTIYKSLSFAGETDTAQSVTYSQPQSISFTYGPESDNAQALSFTKTIYKSLTNNIETDTVQAFSATKTIYKNISNGIETDSAQVLTFTQTHFVNIIAVIETDAPQTLSFAKTIYKSLTNSSETDTAQSISFTKTIYKSLVSATETDLVQTVAYSQAGAIDIVSAIETDNAQTLSFTKTIYKTLSFAGESDAAQTITYTQIELRRRALVSWLEFEIPKGFAAQEKSITYGSESDSAQALTEHKDKTLTFASETDTTQALSFTKTIHKSLIAASETDSIQALTYTKTIQKTLTPAVETDTTQTLSLTHIHYRSLSAITETDQAQALSFTKTIYESLIFATESSIAQLLTYSQAQSQTITTTLETDSAQALSFTKTIQKSLTFVTESTQAQSLSVTKTTYKTLVSGDETDSAQVASITKIIFKAITEIAETDVAQSLTEQKIKILSVSSEIDSAQTLSFTKTIYKTLTAVDETDAGMPLSLGGMEVIVYATETDIAQSLRILKLSVTSETESAQPLTLAKTITLVATVETDTATLLDHGQDLRRALVSWIEFELPSALGAFIINYASESDIAQALAFEQAGPQLISIVSAIETESSESLNIDKQIVTVASSEIDSVQALSATKVIYKSLDSSAESDIAQALSITHVHYRSITATAESDSAQALSVAKVIFEFISSATETDAAEIFNITHIHYRTLAAVLETDTAYFITLGGMETIIPAFEADLAQGLKIPKLIVVSEIDIAQAISYTKVKNIISAVESDIAQIANYIKTVYKSLIAAQEPDQARVINVNTSVGLSFASETDTLNNLIYGKYTYIVPSGETDSAQILPPAGITCIATSFPMNSIMRIS